MVHLALLDFGENPLKTLIVPYIFNKCISVDFGNTIQQSVNVFVITSEGGYSFGGIHLFITSVMSVIYFNVFFLFVYYQLHAKATRRITIEVGTLMYLGQWKKTVNYGRDPGKTLVDLSVEFQ